MSLRILSPGTFSLLVDGGRPATRGFGIPVGGPADRASLMLGNALVGNPPLAPALAEWGFATAPRGLTFKGF